MRITLVGSRKKENLPIKKWDWLLICGLSLAPMTGFRVWKVGPAEVLCLLWCLRFYPKARLSCNDTFRFFAAFLFSMVMGTIVCFFVAPREAAPKGLLTWIYLAYIGLAVYEGLSSNTLAYNERLVSTGAIVASLWYLFLYAFGRTVSRSFLGVPIWYRGVRFSAGATNPHQIACMLCALIFILIRNFFSRKKTISLVLMMGDLFLLIQTTSSTGYLSVAVGFVIVAYCLLIRRFPGKEKVVLLLLLLVIGAFFTLFFDFLMELFLSWVRSDANGQGRLNIFSTIGTAFKKDPIFGIGPGTHGRDGKIEFHNTYLEVLAATGLVGIGALLVYTVRILKKCSRSDPFLLPIIFALYAYGTAGFAMRRLVYWVITAMVLVLAEQIQAQKVSMQPGYQSAFREYAGEKARFSRSISLNNTY